MEQITFLVTEKSYVERRYKSRAKKLDFWEY